VYLFGHKKLKELILVSVFFMILFGCSPSPFDFASRQENPLTNEKSQKCKVSSFEIENAIVIRWDKNDKAKKYILYKDDVANGDFSNVIYEGEDLSFIDKNVDIEKIYYYKLAIKFDNWVSQKSDYSYGVAGVLEDDFEDNDTKEVTKILLSDLTSDIKANIFYFEDNFNNLLKDEDWYKVKVSADSSTDIRIDLSSDVTNDQLLFSKENATSISINNENKNFLFANTSNSPMEFYFKISTNTSFKNKIGNYKITIIPNFLTLPAPESVTAEIVNNKINVNWTSVAGVTSYQVFRKVGTSEFVMINETDVIGTNYVDASCDFDKDISYKIKSKNNNFYSQLSIESNVVKITSLVAPESVTAEIVNNKINVNWTSVAGVTSYQVFRKVGTFEFVMINETDVIGTNYVDTSYDFDKDISYKIKSKNNNFYSQLSIESNVVKENSTAIMINNNTLKASIFEFNNKIQISWELVSGVSSYKIYRYSSKKIDELLDASFSSNSNFYEDTNANANVPYFYRVSCIKDGREYAKSELVFGSYSSTIDSYEPNNTFSTVENLNSSSIFVDNQKPIVYSIKDGSGIITDEDWYKYKGLPLMIFVDVELNSLTKFNNGDVKIVFYYNGQYTTPQNILKGQINKFSFSNYGVVQNEVSVYFKIFVDNSVVSKDQNFIETYKVSLSNSF